MLAMNEALMLGSVRQHELTEAAENLNARLQAEIDERKRAEAKRRMDVLSASNRKMKQEIVRRQVVEKSLRKSERHQIRLLEQSRHIQEQLRNLSHQVLQAQEEERKRVSRELHDVIAQTLTGINVRLATLKKEAALNTKGLDRNIAQTQELIEHSVDIIHQFARELRPAVLDDLGLIPALHAFMQQFTERTGVHTRLTAFAGVEKMDLDTRTVLFRVAQEALTNVARHAEASRVKVCIQKTDDGVCMEIEDDGKSFRVQRGMLDRGGKRLGLLGMRERIEMIGGNFDVKSAPGKGTTIYARIPFKKLRGMKH
jgi:signal transduction histidine kinase